MKSIISLNNQKKLFLSLLLIVLFLGTVNIVKGLGLFIPAQPELKIVDNSLSLESMTLEQKIAQMVITHGGLHNMQAWKKLQLGGIHLFAMQTENLFKQTITRFQQDQQIPFFVTADMEGCLNPFSAFRNSTSVSDILTPGMAFEKGKADGKFLINLGFNINFAPVVDLDDQIWKCRSFPGNKEEISELAESYVLGIQNEGIIATAKHYPGKTLVVRDPHKHVVSASIVSDDIFPYLELSDTVDSVMVSHLITTGAVDSGSLPSVTSKHVIDDLKKNYAGLIISDEIQMLGLRNFYDSLDEVYINVFKAGNDLVLNFGEDPEEMLRMIQVVAEAVRSGEIPETQIDASVSKILRKKGFEVR
jgi:beta-N-acetylhexosaminidase